MLNRVSITLLILIGIALLIAAGLLLLGDEMIKEDSTPWFVQSGLMYWAYRHVDGKIHLKRYWKDSASDDAIEDAYDSDFVFDVLEPFEAETRAEAEEIARRDLEPIS